MEKIKINLDKITLNKLYQDMSAFNYVKVNGDLNKNKFLNVLIKNYFPIYDDIANKEIKKISQIITTYINDLKYANLIINELVKSDDLFSFNKENNLKEFISFKPSTYNSNIIQIIYNKYLKYQSLSSFFRKMISHYLSLPQYKREQIIFLENYTLICEAIESKRKISILLKDTAKEVTPYKIVTNKEEIYNYLICFSDNKSSINISSYHLFKIDHIYLHNERVSINENNHKLLDQVANYSPQFPFSKIQNSLIELTENGIKLFQSKYLNRPMPYKIENNKYYFNCSPTHLLVYFFSFGKDAKVIEPSTLKETFKKAYLDAYDSYKE